MPIIGWNELEKISLEYITGKVNAIVSKLIQENQLKAYDDDVLKNLLNGWFMHIAIHAKNLKELADKKDSVFHGQIDLHFLTLQKYAPRIFRCVCFVLNELNVLIYILFSIN